MLQRLYVHNYRCLENFEFKPGDVSSGLLIGKNGTGKSTLAQALRIFQAIGRGSNRVGTLVEPRDMSLGRTETPMRLELQVLLNGQVFNYALVLELPERFRELRVLEEQLLLDGEALYSRKLAQITLQKQNPNQAEAHFNMDWHLVALPVIQDPSTTDALSCFREWLARMVLLAPLPRLMRGEAQSESLEPNESASNLADWLSGLLAHYPAAYAPLSQYLREVMPDLSDFRFERTGKDVKTLLVRFRVGNAQHELDFDMLSDGEKCFFVCGVVIAANQSYGALLVFWDEPDNYLSLNEVSHFVMALRRAFHQSGQILMTSHNEETVRRFSNDNTWVLGRDNHLAPTILRPLADLSPRSDLIQALICGELEP